jgi:oxaloacetate decarboxylase (Na+ extruding) subunit alpha
MTVNLVDVTMRDGNQSLWGATGLNTAHMLQAAALTERCGFRAVDFTSSSHMAVAVRYFQNNPWERIRRMRAAMPNTPLQFISHNTLGLGEMSSLEAAKLGISAIHVGVGPGGDGSSLPEAQRMVANLREAGQDVAIDRDALAQLSDYWSRLARAEGLPPGTPQGFDASFLRHQIAGGVMTTTKRQLEELGLGHRLADVIAETEQVRAELGYPIMVTPFPQMVMSQALFNVIGDSRYAQVSDQVIRYVLGKFGKPTNPIDPVVLSTILDRPHAKMLMAEDDFPTLSDLRKTFGATMNDEEFLLRAVMPSDQVDAMLSAGRSCATYSPEFAPLLALLKKLAARPAARDIAIERPGLRIALHAGASL